MFLSTNVHIVIYLLFFFFCKTKSQNIFTAVSFSWSMHFLRLQSRCWFCYFCLSLLMFVLQVDYEYNTSSGKMEILHGRAHFTSNLPILLQWSPYSTEAELLKQVRSFQLSFVPLMYTGILSMFGPWGLHWFCSSCHRTKLALKRYVT